MCKKNKKKTYTRVITSLHQKVKFVTNLKKKSEYQTEFVLAFGKEVKFLNF